MSTASPAPSLRSGPSNELLGTLCFLAAEAMFFLGLVFVALQVRRDSVTWPPADAPDIHLLLPMANTLALITSSLLMHAAVRAVRRNDRKALLRRLGLTTALGIVFVSGQVYEFAQLGGWRPGEGVYRSLFDTLVGFHAVHVMAGVGLLAVVLGRAFAGHFNAERHTAVAAAELYWHFVTAAWLLVFAVLLNFDQLPQFINGLTSLVHGGVG
jgi:cytochrome c oxidase subunit 3